MLSPPQHDGILRDSIIWSARVGVQLNGGGQQISGLHPWNYINDPADGHQTSNAKGLQGVGILVTGSGGRIHESYLDTVPIVVNGSSVDVRNNWFFRNASVVVRASKWQHPVASGVTGLVVTGNLFTCYAQDKSVAPHGCATGAVLLDEDRAGGRWFGDVLDSVVAGNTVSPDIGLRSTQARKVSAWLSITRSTAPKCSEFRAVAL